MAGRYKSAKSGYQHHQQRAAGVGTLAARGGGQAGNQRHQQQRIPLHDAHGAWLQALHMLQIQAKGKQRHTTNTDQQQDLAHTQTTQHESSNRKKPAHWTPEPSGGFVNAATISACSRPLAAGAHP